MLNWSYFDTLFLVTVLELKISHNPVVLDTL